MLQIQLLIFLVSNLYGSVFLYILHIGETQLNTVASTPLNASAQHGQRAACSKFSFSRNRLTLRSPNCRKLHN
ncbi:hypothetical protein [Nostoc sp. UCD121]|uniref:hypothetical protein n=1 Tax=Nostoc sp. UCD121 TaxID=2681305 RepID=UPI001623B331|nr:hypothetical protein [Nostoc sp. UCD121]MBC1220779.1 hypothetical protein [Nostoc sp. UCD120]